MLYPAIVTGSSSIEGVGLFATQDISAGTIVWYLDANEKRLSQEELKQLSDGERRLVYQAGEKEFILLTDRSEVLNHSCDPNLWWEDDETLVARRDIKSGEEITYDYATSDNNSTSLPEFECNCGSAGCRRRVSYKDSQNDDFQKCYKGHLTSWVVRLDNKKTPA